MPTRFATTLLALIALPAFAASGADPDTPPPADAPAIAEGTPAEPATAEGTPAEPASTEPPAPAVKPAPTKRTFATQQTFTSQMRDPNPFSRSGWKDTYTNTWALVTWTQDGLDIKYEETTCGVQTQKVFGAETIYTKAFLDAIPVRKRTAKLSGTEPGARFTAGPYVQAFGVKLDDPFNDPLPTDDKDPRLVDTDGDGKPGTTVVIRHPVVGTGQVYVAQRSVARLQGTVAADGRITGQVYTAPDMFKIGADKWWLRVDSPQRPHPDPARSPFVMVPVDATTTCADVLSKKGTLFGKGYGASMRTASLAAVLTALLATPAAHAEVPVDEQGFALSLGGHVGAWIRPAADPLGTSWYVAPRLGLWVNPMVSIELEVGLSRPVITPTEPATVLTPVLHAMPWLGLLVDPLALRPGLPLRPTVSLHVGADVAPAPIGDDTASPTRSPLLSVGSGFVIPIAGALRARVDARLISEIGPRGGVDTPLTHALVTAGIETRLRLVADRDRDWVPDRIDACPDEPEDIDGFEDDDGCRDPDNDGDGVRDELDACDTVPEDLDGVDDFDGCPEP